MSGQALPRQVLTAMLAIAGIAGVWFTGYQFGQSGKDRAVSEASAVGEAELEISRSSEQNLKAIVANQQEIIAYLVELARSPAVNSVLPEAARLTVEKAVVAIDEGDLPEATALLPGVVAALNRDCVPEGQSVAVEPGTPIRTCHEYGTRALIGQIVNAEKEVRVTVDGKPDNVGFGAAYQSEDGNACDVLIEKRDRIDDKDVIWASFACS